jgi:hypothetical protein
MEPQLTANTARSPPMPRSAFAPDNRVHQGRHLKSYGSHPVAAEVGEGVRDRIIIFKLYIYFYLFKIDFCPILQNEPNFMYLIQ